MAISLADQSHSFFLIPVDRARLHLEQFKAEQGTGKQNATALLCASGLFLAQTVSSVVAVPLQLIAGVFGSLKQLSAGEGKRALTELRIGLVTSGKHAISSVVSVGAALFFMTCLAVFFPCLALSWNQAGEPRGAV